ncbi:DUF3592 domain-containing protein [Micromonospora sp. NBC_01655]|uniref:DUF3592 domain-containing protein n=1 Tax=Micromonospora sp. NBC_01655 TaxID=2975983 RepID=UPI00225B9FE5|nr:DUF3592 domain-containing protein [Micromonospora sp. NBC_01655]MCX4473060.1 DUF3592 domain-containing protein [Micromonospora sp. NBC_01655]
MAALVGYGMSLAGVTKAQRTVRLTGRIERVREPRQGGSRKGGISVVVSYRNPASGQEVTVTNDGERGEMITSAWEGREIGVNHPRGRPHAYQFSNTPQEPSRGLGWPSFALFLVYVGLVVLAAVNWGWPWALIGLGGPWAIFAAVHLPGGIRAKNRRIERLAAMDTVQGHVVAVLKDVSVDRDDGHTSTTITPVVSFTTREDTAVTAYCTSNLPDPAGAYGRDVTVHYMSADPAEFTLDRTAEHRSEERDVTFNVLAIVVLVATAVAGVVML